MKIRSLFISTLLLAGLLPAAAQSVKLTAGNIDAVLKAMTLEEKARLLVGERQTKVPGAAGATAAIPRLGIPQTILSDGPAGLRINPTRKDDARTYYTTAFPVGSLVAATWNVELAEQTGKAMGDEVLQYGCDVLLAPGLNIHRSPLCGRNFEYYSEDPLLAGKMAACTVRGIQSNGVGTSVKHFAVNSQETERTSVNEVVSKRTLRELYLRNFEIAVREGHPWTVMSSYNRLNGPFTQENRQLLTTLLREEWGFDGIVMTDWTGTRNTVAQVHAGNDLMEPGNNEQVTQIVEAVKGGTLAMEDVDICVKRILQYIVKTPAFRGYKYSNRPDLEAHARLVRESAPEGMVLLKNENAALPMQGVKTVALFGAQSYATLACGLGSGCVNIASAVSLAQGLSNAGINHTADLSDLYKMGRDFDDAHSKMLQKSNWDRAAGRTQYPELAISRYLADEQAKKSDLAIITIAHEAGEGWDRPIEGWRGFNLTADELDMIKNVTEAYHAAGKKVVVVINSGSVMETASWKARPDAILMAWQPGGEAGNAIADVLTGKANPSGKLPMTWPIDVMDHPSSKNFPTRKGTNDEVSLHHEGLNVGYRYFDTARKEVSYPFGYGLSYTTFAYSKPQVKATKDGFTATVTVKNTGKVAGKESVQLYVSAPKGKLEKPAKELRAFAKTRKLAPGESQTLSFAVSRYALASFDESASQWIADAGQYAVLFGANVEDIRCQAAFTLKKAYTQQVNDILQPDQEL